MSLNLQELMVQAIHLQFFVFANAYEERLLSDATLRSLLSAVQ
jgi:hypothetical protein